MPSADTFGENYCTNVLVLIIKYISIDGLEDGQTRAVATAVRSEGEARNHESQLRPFLMQSDSASRKRPFSTRLFFDWILLVLLLIVSRVDFIVFVLFLEAVGVREDCCMALEQSVGRVENGPFRLDSLGPSFYRQSSRFYGFCALPRGGWCEGVLLYGARNSVGSAVLRAFLASNACFTRDEPSSKRTGGVGLSRKPPKLRLWRCTQPRDAKATAGVAVVG